MKFETLYNSFVTLMIAFFACTSTTVYGNIESLISISGKVATQDGLVFPGVTVTYSFASGLASATTLTDSAGHYSLPSVTPGLITISVTSTSFQFQFTFKSDIVLDSTVSNLDITLPSYIVDTVSIYDNNNNPVSGYSATLQSSPYDVTPQIPIFVNGTNPYGIFTGGQTYSDLFGKAKIYIFPNLKNPSHQVYIKAQNGALGGVVASSQPFVTTIVRSDIVINLPKVITISGQIVASNGSPVPNIICGLSSPVGANGYATTDSNGYYSFGNQNGAGNITISLDNIYDSYQYGVPSCFQISNSLYLSDNTYSLIATLPDTVTITVSVVDSSGNQMAGVQLWGEGKTTGSQTICSTTTPLFNKGSSSGGCVTEIIQSPYSTGCRSGMTSTNSAGVTTVTFFKNPGMIINIKAYDQYNRGQTSADIVLDSDSSTVITFPINLITVSGFFINAGTGQPIIASGINIEMGGTGQVLSAKTDVTGRYTLTHLAPGLMNVRATAIWTGNPQYPSGWYLMTNTQVQESTYDLNFTISKFFTRSVSVVDELGSPVPNVQIHFVGSDTYIGVTGMGAVYFGPGTVLSTTDSNGKAFVSEFYIPGTTIQLGAVDTLNSARAATASVDLSQNTAITFVLPSPPSPPQNVNTTVGNTTTVVQWQPPANNGGLPLTNYTVIATPMNATTTTITGSRRSLTEVATITTTPPLHTQISVTVHPTHKMTHLHGLLPGTAYKLSVVASNVLGQSKPTSLTIRTKGAANPPNGPSSKPTSSPVAKPSTASPTKKPVSVPPTTRPITTSPTSKPSSAPTLRPVTKTPTNKPSAKPVSTKPSSAPTINPSSKPTSAPSFRPVSKGPTTKPTAKPTSKPTLKPVVKKEQ